jgi:hypothetical protein
MNSTDLLDDLLGLYASPMAWARAALQLEHNAEDYQLPDGSYDYRAFLLDVENACSVNFIELDCGVAVIYHG